MYLIDTNIISEALKRAPNLGVLRWLETAQRSAISAITLDEITYGLTLHAKPTFQSASKVFLKQ